jgi:hypothetical protein
MRYIGINHSRVNAADCPRHAALDRAETSGASMARNADEWKNDGPHFLFEMGDVMLMGDADA